MRNGHIKRITDDDIASSVLEVVSANVSTTYISCPSDPQKTLGIKLPFLVMIIKNLKKYFSFEVQVLDDKNVRRRFRASNYQVNLAQGRCSFSCSSSCSSSARQSARGALTALPSHTALPSRSSILRCGSLPGLGGPSSFWPPLLLYLTWIHSAFVQSTTRVKPFICTMPMRLDDGWNQIQFNLADFTRRAYGACWALWHVCTDACSCAEPHAARSWLQALLKCPMLAIHAQMHYTWTYTCIIWACLWIGTLVTVLAG